MTQCPKCKKEVDDNHFACVHSSDIGKIMTEKKRRALVRNVKKRWKDVRAKKTPEKKTTKEDLVMYYKKHFKPI